VKQRTIAWLSASLPAAAFVGFFLADAARLRAEDECVENCEEWTEQSSCPVYCLWDDKKYSINACLKTSGCAVENKVQACRDDGTWSSCVSACAGYTCPPKGDV